MDTSNELRFNAPCSETVYCFKFKSLVFSSRVCAGAPAIPSWKFDSSNARKSVVGAKRHQDLFLKVATIGFSSEINPPMLRTWLLGKEKLFVREGHACVAYRRPNALEKLEFPTHDIHTHTTYTHTHTRRQTQARKQAHTQAYAQAPFLPPSLSLFSRSLFEAHVKSILVRIASLAS